MTALQVHTWCQYLTAGGDWRDVDHDARKIIKAVKGEDFNGYLDVLTDGKTIRITSANKDVGLSIASQVLAAKLDELTKKPVSLVPIPNSSACVENAEVFRTLVLASSIAEYSGCKAIAEPALLWAEPKEKQHQKGGYRRAKHFISNLSLVSIPEHPVVLVDDVVTSGSQMLAAAHNLRAAGIPVLFGIAVGKTTSVQTPNAVNWVEETITQVII